MRKPFRWLSVAIVLAMGVMVFAFMIQKVGVAASGGAYVEHGWNVQFTAPLSEQAIEKGAVYVTDQQGKKVKAKLELSKAGKELQVKGLEPGEYALNIDDQALTKNFLKSFKQNKIKFTMYESIETVTSADELKAYFEMAKNLQSKGQSEAIVVESVQFEEERSDKASSESSGHSETNVQVQGIDEPDIMKTDGDYVYTIAEKTVRITDIRNDQLKKAASIKMEEDFYPSQLFIQEDTLIVLGEKMIRQSKKIAAGDQIMPMDGMTTIRLYDVKNKTAPKLLREVGAEGYLSSARMTDGTVYVVTNLYPMIWALDEIDGATVRPRITDTASKGLSYMAYEDIAILPGATEPSYTVVTAIDLKLPEKSELSTKGYLGSSEQLYMSKDHLYLTATKYNFEESGSKAMIWNPGTANTQFFKFTLDGLKVEFTGSTGLKGTVLNQFSMDEHNGYFRVVMTEGHMWNDKNPSKNHLFVLDKGMKLVGSVENLAKGERIYSARFMGDKAYMVTFRETDPLFVIDVANPAKPKVLGELKIPGFSNYLHPLDENHLIGFGYETVAEKNPSGGEPFIRTKGMKLSLFDVTDFANPKEKDTVIIGGEGTYSPVQYNHKALFQHAGRNLYGFPVSVYEEGSKQHELVFKGSGALIYEITPERGFSLQGDLVQKPGKGQQYEEWETQVQRLLYSKDRLYTVSNSDLTSYDFNSFTRLGQLKWNDKK
ncbi:beta-propeller domain-containing protein [Sporosarcina sp. Te-1]|uniref:beta-propeller domain-containing protein n=1 Tax=Sporosarcina sp. Te-1 TaxID=2818390 RepID=UPI001A9DC3A9|nr:beta-propeller domain-containing protein [Sporosarcina sp. Te-1]QTD40586.1 beta-propeller domain-containing protein [Sporosarcina sp. Te-1]